MAGAGHLRQSPNVGLQGCASRSLWALCNEPANQQRCCSPALTHPLPLKSRQEREKKRSVFSCYSLLPPPSVGVEGGRGEQPQGQTQGPVGLIKSSPTSLWVKVLCAAKHFCVHLVHSFGTHEQDTCCVTGSFLGAGTIALNKEPTSPAEV